MDIGMDLGSAVSPAYRKQAPFAFNGTIKEVIVEIKPK
jgi:arylsulfatase